MATDYILFIHGVNVRDQAGFEAQANQMFQRIKATVDPARVLKPVVLFWGDVGLPAAKSLQDGLESSTQWNQLWFRDLRTTQILPFVGDAAMYLSRVISTEIIQELFQQALKQFDLTLEQLRNPPSGDRLHLVSHSWGTVVLFDIMFATRWEDPDLPPAVSELVKKIRLGFFGVGTAEERNYGIPLASIHTMGSPIALFNLININKPSSFDLTPNLENFLQKLSEKLEGPLLWNNFMHPGDPIAYPLEGVMPLFVKESARPCVRVKDIITTKGSINGLLGKSNLPILSMLPLLDGGKAHGSYWAADNVAQTVAQAIVQSA